jgi:hypothetical protein
MGLIKLGIVLYGIHLITSVSLANTFSTLTKNNRKKIREDRHGGGHINHHEDPANHTSPCQKPPGYPQRYPAPSQYQPQSLEHQNEKRLYSDMPKGEQPVIIGDHQLQIREAPAYDDVMSKRAAHECPDCGHGGLSREKGEKGLL